jgi:hypothetical protein
MAQRATGAMSTLKLISSTTVVGPHMRNKLLLTDHLARLIDANSVPVQPVVRWSKPHF